MAKKQRRKGVAGATPDRQRQARRRDQPGVLRAIREHRQLVPPIGQRKTGADDQSGAAGAQLCRGGQRIRQRLDPQSREVRQLEAVGQDDIGKRGQALRDRFGTPSLTNTPGSWSPITGSQQYGAPGCAARTAATARATTPATPGSPR